MLVLRMEALTTRLRCIVFACTAFHGMHVDALVCALRQLEVDGRAKCGHCLREGLSCSSDLLHRRLFKGDTADDQGVKFFAK